jgi:branched-subunit amino acid transport protein
MSKAIITIIGMAAVTFLPRSIPALLMGKVKLGKKVKKYLRLIPYTAMAALIFPGVFLVDAARPEIGIAGGGIAAILAYKKVPIMICVISAVILDMLLYYFLP